MVFGKLWAKISLPQFLINQKPAKAVYQVQGEAYERSARHSYSFGG
jgi:hypothetical protein